METRCRVPGLKSRCEAFIIKTVQISISSLEFASKYKLEKRKAKCMQTIKANFSNYIDELAQLGPSLAQDIMEDLWPTICDLAGVPKAAGLPPQQEIKNMWPFHCQSDEEPPQVEASEERTEKATRCGFIKAMVCAKTLGIAGTLADRCALWCSWCSSC